LSRDEKSVHHLSGDLTNTVRNANKLVIIFENVSEKYL